MWLRPYSPLPLAGEAGRGPAFAATKAGGAAALADPFSPVSRSSSPRNRRRRHVRACLALLTLQAASPIIWRRSEFCGTSCIVERCVCLILLIQNVYFPGRHDIGTHDPCHSGASGPLRHSAPARSGKAGCRRGAPGARMAGRQPVGRIRRSAASPARPKVELKEARMCRPPPWRAAPDRRGHPGSPTRGPGPVLPRRTPWCRGEAGPSPP